MVKLIDQLSETHEKKKKKNENYFSIANLSDENVSWCFSVTWSPLNSPNYHQP